MSKVVAEAHALLDNEFADEFADPTLFLDPTRSISGVNALTILREAQTSSSSSQSKARIDMSEWESREAELVEAGRTADEVAARREAIAISRAIELSLQKERAVSRVPYHINSDVFGIAEASEWEEYNGREMSDEEELQAALAISSVTQGNTVGLVQQTIHRTTEGIDKELEAVLALSTQLEQERQSSAQRKRERESKQAEEREQER
jgi:hypothetical protein